MKHPFRRLAATLRKCPAIAIALVLLAVAPCAHSQKITASFGGTVYDPHHAVIPGAKVQIENNGTGRIRSVKTSAAGLFNFPLLNPGTYTLTISANGFKTLVRNGITLQVDQSTSLNFTLPLGSTAETVTVTGAPPLLETQSSTVGEVIPTKSILDLPLNQRNVYSLILLAPGVTGSVGSSFSGMDFSVDGGRAGTTDVLIDGVPSSPPTDGFNTLTIFPSVDATKEFKVMTTNYSAEFGLSGGGIINVIFKSGTNHFHGSLYEFNRNSALDSNYYFNNQHHVPLPNFNRNQFGFSLGGPVWIPKVYNGRNHLFFFTDYEGLRQNTATSMLTTVPTVAERAGNFSGDTTSTGQPITIYDPLTSKLVDGTWTRQPFPNNTIPSSRFDPVAKNILKYFPLPNTPGINGTNIDNYFAAGSSPYNINQYDIRADADIANNQHLDVRYSFRNSTQSSAQLFPAAIAIAQNAYTEIQKAASGELDYMYARSPNSTWEFRFGLAHLYFIIHTRADGFNPTTLGFPSYIATQALHYSANSLTFPGIGPSGYVGLGDGGNLGKGQLGILGDTWMLDNTRTYSRQTLSFGAEVRVYANNADQNGRSTGSFGFGPNMTQGPNALKASPTAGDGFASFLLGIRGGDLTPNFKIIDTVSQYIGAYVQDDWRLTDNFTANLGLRYNLFIPRTERHNRMTWFNTTVASPLTGLPNLHGGIEYPGTNGNPRQATKTYFKNFAPRIGFAYTPWSKIVVHGGFGIFYAPTANEAAASVEPTGYRTDSPYLGTLNGVTPNNYLSNPYPGASFIPVTGSSQGLMTSTGAGVVSQSRRSPTPYTENWNLGFQYQFLPNWLLGVRYVGNHGVQLLYNAQLNQLPDADLALKGKLLAVVPNPLAGKVEAQGPLYGPTTQARYLMTPYPQFTGIQIANASGAVSRYDALQMQVQRQFRKNFMVMVGFTEEKSFDDWPTNNGNVAGYGKVYQDASIPLDKDMYSLSASDVPRILHASFIYGLPFGRGQLLGAHWNRAVNALLGGYQINGIFSAETGTPLGFAAANVANIFNPGERPNWNGMDARLHGRVENRLNEYFNTKDFSQPAPYTFGNMPATSSELRTPGGRNLDVSLFKTFALHHGQSVEVRGEAFNVFNTPQFGGPNTNVSSGAFGTIGGTVNSPRQMQLAVKFLF